MASRSKTGTAASGKPPTTPSHTGPTPGGEVPRLADGGGEGEVRGSLPEPHHVPGKLAELPEGSQKREMPGLPDLGSGHGESPVSEGVVRAVAHAILRVNLFLHEPTQTLLTNDFPRRMVVDHVEGGGTPLALLGGLRLRNHHEVVLGYLDEHQTQVPIPCVCDPSEITHSLLLVGPGLQAGPLVFC